MNRANHNTGLAFEQQVFHLFQLHPNYMVSHRVRTDLREGKAYSDSDLLVTYRQGIMTYSVLIECKADKHRIRKGVVFELEARRSSIGAHVALLVTMGDIQSGVPGVLATFPHLHHFTAAKLQGAIQSGRLDDMIPLLANADVRDDPSIAGMVAVVRAFDRLAISISRSGSRLDPRLCLRAASELIKIQYFVLSEVSANTTRSRVFPHVVRPHLSETTQALLQRRGHAYEVFGYEWLDTAREAATRLFQEHARYNTIRMPWQRSVYRLSFRALEILHDIVTGDDDALAVPSQQMWVNPGFSA